jgi:tetratricopeptide (TPR) repeat protein
VFADEDDVLDKLEWLFQRPDELARITSAGKQLVDSHHTMRQREQVFQWYTLHKKLKPGQKIVQLGPFMPLTIVDENSGIKNGHITSGGLDRLLMNQANELVLVGKYNDAANLYRRCLNYNFPHIPEAKFRLILCLLYQGNFKAALSSVREVFPSHRLSRDGWEPDPTEWAWFILVLLCCGKNHEAALRAEQFLSVDNEELHRVRSLVRMLSGASTNKMAGNAHNAAERASVHCIHRLTIDEWLENVRRMLKACGQSKTAATLARASSTLRLLDTAVSSTASPDSTTAANETQKHYSYVKKTWTSITKQRSLRNAGLEYFLAAGSRARSAAQRHKLRLERLMKGIRGITRYWSTWIEEDDWAIILRLFQKEEILTGLLIGAADGSWLSHAFLSGIQENPKMPSAVCVNYNTPQFRKFHKRFVGNANVEFRYLPGEGEVFHLEESADVVAVECSEVLKEVRCKAVRATLLVLNCINNQAGSEFFQTLRSGEDYDLVLHEPSRCNGYAVFRRVAIKAGQPGQQAA